ncbi:heme exporter protein CcmD [Oceanibium sediminis]|uniref:heme exporter protein CcmD n=1 Tax=Oceanibium sediminis TaxID=2026339 RepID=UPI000DD3BA23|nr:heme exporter protein CcmD [Oceanibium sediminis]
MPDLGTYAGAVLGAYGISFALLGGLVALTLLRAARAKKALAAAEARNGGIPND